MKQDVGKNKALCLIEKINFCFNLQWEGVPIEITKNTIPKVNILITAVDNASFRLEVANSLSKQSYFGNSSTKQLYWMDTGNGKDFGQVVLGTIQAIKQPKSKKDFPQDTLPNVIDFFGDVSQFDTKETQGMDSCSFLESIEQQDLFINDAIALAASIILWKLFSSFYILHHGVIINQNTFTQKGINIRSYE